MAIDSFKVRENKSQKVEEKKFDFSEFKSLIDSLPTNDIDQEWVKENESKEFSFSQQQSVNNHEENIDDIIMRLDEVTNLYSHFQSMREQNNQRRSEMRNQQISSLIQELNYEEMDIESISKSF